MEEKQRQTERWAEGLISDLEQEITELKRRNSDLEKVARSDHIHFLKVNSWKLKTQIDCWTGFQKWGICFLLKSCAVSL